MVLRDHVEAKSKPDTNPLRYPAELQRHLSSSMGPLTQNLSLTGLPLSVCAQALWCCDKTHNHERS